jgi:hypothetical protein
MSLRAASSRARRNFVSLSSRCTRARSASASSRATVARACSTCVSKSEGSSSAITWPRRTRALKSARNDLIVPETWVPTCTVVTACTLPVASTCSTTSPRVTTAVTRAGRAVVVPR